MSKPGILDPWRQAPPKPPPAKMRGIEQFDEEIPERCVTWEGGNAGFNVWMPADTESHLQAAIDRVHGLMRDLAALNDKDVRAAFGHFGIHENYSDVRHPVELLALVTRRALLSSRPVAAILARSKITAFVK